MKRGSLIIFEGVDRCGKTTQVKKLSEKLVENGHSIYTTRFPERTSEIGQMINAYLKNTSNLSDQAVHLLFSANRWEYDQLLREKLKGGTTVIIDRYAFSGVAFSAAKGLDLEWCKTPDKGLPKPDMVIQLTVDQSCAQGRGGFGEERYETTDFQSQVRKMYSTLEEENNDIWRRVDGSGTIEQVTEKLSEIVLEVMGGEKSDDIQKLWL